MKKGQSIFIRFRGLLIFSALFLTESARADGGWICLQQTKEPYRITVFAQPAPLRAGPSDFSVLVQDWKSGRAMTDAGVVLTFIPNFSVENSKDGEWLPPCCRLEANTLGSKALLGVGGNRLLYEIRTSLAQPGEWKLELSITREGQTVMMGGAISVGPAAPPWFVYWPYLTVPFLGMGFLALNWQARRSLKQSKEPG